MPRILIFTLSWNGLSLLSQLKPTLISSLRGLDYTWHIRDNGSADGTVDADLADGNKNIIVHSYPNNNQTFSEGMNWLYKQSSANPEDYVLLLNNDVIFNDTTSIKNMISTFSENVGVVGARLLYTNTNRIQHAGVVFHPQSRTPFHYRANEESDEHSKQNRYFQAVTGAVFLTKAKYFVGACTTNKSGNCGLDESLKWAFDDIDLSLSISKKFNKKVVYCGGTDIYHGESVSLKKNPVNKLFMQSNINYFKTKWQTDYIIDAYHYLSNKNYNLMK